MWRIEWLETALNELTSIWLKSGPTTRRAVTVAVRQIEHALSIHPEEEGESRTEGRRILFAEPLAVVFEVDEPNRQATIVTVWHFGRRGDRP